MSVLLNWENNATPDALLVYRSTSSIPSSPLSLTPFATLPADALTYLDTTALSSSTYFYRVANIQYGTSPDTIAMSDEIYVATGSAQPANAPSITIIDLSTVTSQDELDIDVQGYDEMILFIDQVDNTDANASNKLGLIEFSRDGGSTFESTGTGTNQDFRRMYQVRGDRESPASVTSDSDESYNSDFWDQVNSGEGSVEHSGFMRFSGFAAEDLTYCETHVANKFGFRWLKTGAWTWDSPYALTTIRVADFARLPSPPVGTLTIYRYNHRNIAPINTLDFTASPYSKTIPVSYDRFNFQIEDFDVTVTGERASYLLSQSDASTFVTSNSYARASIGQGADTWLDGTDGSALAYGDLGGSGTFNYNGHWFYEFNGLNDGLYPYKFGMAGQQPVGGRDNIPNPTFIRFEAIGSPDYDAGIVRGNAVAFHETSTQQTTASGQSAIAFDVDGFDEVHVTWGGELVLSGADNLVLEISTDNGSTWKSSGFNSIAYPVGVHTDFTSPGDGVYMTDFVTSSAGQVRAYGLAYQLPFMAAGMSSFAGYGTSAPWQFFGHYETDTDKVLIGAMFR